MFFSRCNARVYLLVYIKKNYSMSVICETNFLNLLSSCLNNNYTNESASLSKNFSLGTKQALVDIFFNNV